MIENLNINTLRGKININQSPIITKTEFIVTFAFKMFKIMKRIITHKLLQAFPQSFLDLLVLFD